MPVGAPGAPAMSAPSTSSRCILPKHHMPEKVQVGMLAANYVGASGTASGVSASTPGKDTHTAINQCPDEWAKRHRKRLEAIAAAKRSREYQEISNCMQENPAFLDYCQLMMKLTQPDPSDRSISKRSWEKAMQCWRRDLRVAASFLE